MTSTKRPSRYERALAPAPEDHVWQIYCGMLSTPKGLTPEDLNFDPASSAHIRWAPMWSTWIRDPEVPIAAHQVMARTIRQAWDRAEEICTKYEKIWVQVGKISKERARGLTFITKPVLVRDPDIAYVLTYQSFPYDLDLSQSELEAPRVPR